MIVYFIFFGYIIDQLASYICFLTFALLSGVKFSTRKHPLNEKCPPIYFGKPSREDKFSQL